MIELNLLPDVKKEFLKAQRTRNAVISGAILTTIGAGIITVILASTVYIGQNAVIALQKNSVKEKHEKLQSQPEIEKYLTVQNQLKNIASLHDGKYLYSRAFVYLQALNPAAPNNVALASMTLVKEDKTLEITGTARNFEALTTYKATLESAKLSYTSGDSTDTQSVNMFDSVALMDAGLRSLNGVPLVGFRMQLTYPDVIFAPDTKNGKVEVPSVITSDADRNAPKQLFGTDPQETQ